MVSDIEPSSAEIQAGLYGIVREMLRPAAAMLAAAHLIYVGVHAFKLPSGLRGRMMTLDGVTAFLGLGLWVYFSKANVPPAHANRWVGVMAGLALANLAYHISLTPIPSLTTFIVLVIVAASCFFLSWGWMNATLAGGLAVWLEGVVLNPSGDWWNLAHILLIGTILAVVVHSLRWRTYSQYERLKQKLQQTGDRLKQRLAFERILTRISTRFLALRPEEIDQAIIQAMQGVGECLRMDHVCVSRVDGSPSTFELLHEWCAPGAVPFKPRLLSVPTGSLPWCWAKLQADETVQLASLSDAPDEAQADRTLFEQSGVRSFFAVPLIMGGETRGVLTLASERQETAWPEETASLLRVLGELIVASLKRKEAEEEISDLNQQLRQASRLVGLGELATGLAHDLRNGVSSILQYTQGANHRAKRGTLTLEQCAGCIQDIREQAEYMRDFLAMIQQFIRTRTTERVPIRLPEIIKQAVLLVRGKLNEHGVSMSFVEPEEFPTVVADAAQITTVLVNLILNATHAMKEIECERRCIRVSLSHDNPEFVEVCVRDHGPGIPPLLQEKIFEKFYTTKSDGLGLGLVFSRSYIEEHGGKLWYHPTTEMGAEFRFTLPRSI